MSWVASGSPSSTPATRILTGAFFNLLPFFFFPELNPAGFREGSLELEVYGSVVFSYVRHSRPDESPSKPFLVGS